MKLRALLAGLVSLTTLTAQADEQLVTSKITEVTVYADRARVTRAGNVNLPAGTTRLAFAKLPGWIDEGSVRVELVPPTAGEILDVQVVKTYLARPDDEELRKAEAAVQAIADQLGALDDERAVVDAEAKQVESIRAFSLEKLPKDSAAREVKVEEYGGVVKFVSGQLHELAQRRRELDRQRRDLQPDYSARQKALNDLRQKSQLEQRTISVTLKADKAQPATLTLTYLLPGATWEPLHEVRAGDNTDKVTLASFGVVTQTTGEDWDNATLALSTQRPTQTIKIPELEKLLVGGSQLLPKAPTGEADTFQIASGKYSGQIATWNSVQAGQTLQTGSGKQLTLQSGGQFLAELQSNVDRQQRTQSKVAKQFTELQQQRGTTAHFATLGTQTIRSDGRQVRVPIGVVQLAARPKTIAAPEASLNAARTVELINAGKQPLLPGKSLLYVDGAFLGTTEVDFVAPGESFAMFLGVADQLKLSRVLDKKNSSLTWSGKRTRLQVSYLVTVENLAEKPVELQLADRVPVTETEEVRISNVKLTPLTKPDNKGLVKWDAKLAAKETKEFRLEYLLDYPVGWGQRAPAEGPAGGLRKDIGCLEDALK